MRPKVWDDFVCSLGNIKKNQIYFEAIDGKTNIICFNEKQKIGNGFTLPSGPLRQNLKYLNNCDLIFFNGNKDIDFEKNMKKFNSNLEFIYYEYVSSRELAQLKDKELIAFAGIGNPENFFDLLGWLRSFAHCT